MKKYKSAGKYLNFLTNSISNKFNTKNGLNQISFIKNDKFSYEDYKKIQTEGNTEKIDEIFETEENIRILSNYLKLNLNYIRFGLCHGTRQGKEQEWFSKYLDVKVLGTEISETATSFPNTIQWDFHDIKDEWVNSIDFIYSNSLDHSYDGKYCLRQWFKCLRKSGICIINGTTLHSPMYCTKLDPFGFTQEGLASLIDELSEESGVQIETILYGKANSNKHNIKEWYYFMIRKI